MPKSLVEIVAEFNSIAEAIYKSTFNAELKKEKKVTVVLFKLGKFQLGITYEKNTIEQMTSAKWFDTVDFSFKKLVEAATVEGLKIKT